MSTALLRGFALLGLSCTLAATPALAQSEAPQRFVPYADLDLTTRAGQDMLQSRVRHAVNEVCGRLDPGDFGPMREVIMTCRNTAQISTRTQVQMALANAHDGKALARNDMKSAPKAR